MRYRIEFNGAPRLTIVSKLRQLADTLELRVDGIERATALQDGMGAVIGTAYPLVEYKQREG